MDTSSATGLALRDPAVQLALAAMLRHGDTVAMAVRGNCMAPRLRDGQTMTLRKDRRYLPGDVVVFAGQSGALTVHRLLGWVPGPGFSVGAMTKADAAGVIDGLLARDSILGKVVAVDLAAFRVPLRDRAFIVWQHLKWLLKLLFLRQWRYLWHRRTHSLRSIE